MTVSASNTVPSTQIAIGKLTPSPFSVSVYGDPDVETAGLIEGIRELGVLVSLVVVRSGDSWEVISGHRRLACARALGLSDLPCEVRSFSSETDRHRAILEYNQQRRKTFSQQMREADAMEHLIAAEAKRRSQANLRQGTDPSSSADRRNFDGRVGRTDVAISSTIGLGSKDLYRHAR